MGFGLARHLNVFVRLDNVARIRWPLVTNFINLGEIMGKNKGGFYAVKHGRKPGVYMTWGECQQQTNGVQGAKFKKFSTENEAWNFVLELDAISFDDSDFGEAVFAPIPKSKPSHSTVQVAFSQPSTASSSTVTSKIFGDNVTTFLPLGKSVRGLPHTTLPSLRLPSAVSSNANEHTNSTKRKYNEKYDVRIKRFRAAQRSNVWSTGGAATSSWLQNTNESGGTKNISGQVSATCPTVYTDGACESNGRKAARAGIGVYWGPDHPLNVAERLPGRQTNNRAEIHAAVRAIEQAKQQGMTSLTLYTDSQFLISSVTQWIHKWKRNGWQLQSGGPVKNMEDFQELDRVLEGIHVEWVHVRGHHGNPGNEAADLLARQGAMK